jgi:hypothetical protein
VKVLLSQVRRLGFILAPITELERFFWLASIALTAGLIIRLIHDGLHRIYVFFFTYLVVGVVQSLIVLPVDPQSKLYDMVYFITQPVMWLLFILIVLELYSLVLKNHRGIASLGRWTLGAALGLSICVSLLTLSPDLNRATGPSALFVYYTVIERGIQSSLVVFLLLISGFLLWYPIPLSRNVILHAIVYSTYFLCSAAALFMRNLLGLGYTRSVSTALLGIANGCLLVWIVFLNRAGEAKKVVVGHQWKPEDEERLVEQLDAINSALLKTARK